MQVPVMMPQLGLTMTEGTVTTWLKKPGEWIKKGEMLFLVSTEKADMEVESMDEGELAQIVVEPGTPVPVGTVIAYLKGPGDEQVAMPTAAAIGSSPVVSRASIDMSAKVDTAPWAASDSAPSEQSPPVSPRARNVARQLGVDIANVRPSRPGGRVVEEDVRRFAAGSAPQAAPTEAPDLRRRQIIAKRLTESIQTIPHFTLCVQVHAGEVVSLRESMLRKMEPEEGATLTVTDLLLKAVALALAEVPAIKNVWANGTLRPYPGTDLGLAVATDLGVVAPVLRNLESLDLRAISTLRLEATDRARRGRLTITDLEGGIGTLSNLGMYRVDQFQAIISPGQTFILAVGKIEKRPWVMEDKLVVAQTMNLGLSVDHRAADGALAARFLERIAAHIESPGGLVETVCNDTT